MSDPNLGQAAASTLRNRPNEVFDSVTNNNALLAYLKKDGRIKVREGGRTYLVPINFAENSTTKFYDGGLESFSISTESNLDASEWARKFQAGFIYFTEGERQSNRGEAQKVNLVENKIDVLKATLANDFSTAIYNDGTVSNQIVGLQALVADTPTNTVGGIDSNTYSWWKNKTSSGTTSTASNIKSQLVAIWLQTIRGTDKPDIVVAGTDMFTYYHDALSDLQRYTTSDKADVTSFEGLKFQSAMVLYDPTCNAKRMYGLDLSDIELCNDPGKRWVVGSHREVTNATYEVVPVSWSGALTIKRRQSHFVLNGT
jgi:hypothetical protein